MVLAPHCCPTRHWCAAPASPPPPPSIATLTPWVQLTLPHSGTRFYNLGLENAQDERNDWGGNAAAGCKKAEPKTWVDAEMWLVRIYSVLERVARDFLHKPWAPGSKAPYHCPPKLLKEVKTFEGVKCTTLPRIWNQKEKKKVQTENFHKVYTWWTSNSLRAELMFLIAHHYVPRT